MLKDKTLHLSSKIFGNLGAFEHFCIFNQFIRHMTYPIYFVSLGPGDPDLITVKGLKMLQQADEIYCPATLAKEGKTFSRAADMLRALGIAGPAIRPFLLPMDKDRTLAWRAYDTLFTDVSHAFHTGKQTVVVAEGDAGFYSSIQYVYDKLLAAGIEVKRIAGVPAFIAAGALAGLHIVKQEESVVVIPGMLSTEELSEKMKEGSVIVVMKLSTCTEAIHACMQKHPGKQYHYFENVGTEKEFYTSDPETIRQKKFPYFSLMIIQ